MTKHQDAQIRNGFLLFIAALIWGTAFVAQSMGADHVGGFTFTGVRNIIGGTFLIPLIAIFRFKKINERPEEENKAEEAWIAGKNGSRPIVTKTELIGGIICGIALFGASSSQQIGIAHTTTAKAGFLTAMYVIIVPIMGVFFRRKIKPIVWGCVALAIFGLYLLCMKNGLQMLEYGDLLEVLSAFLFAIQIMCIDQFISRTSGVVLSCIQFYTAGVLACICMFIFEEPSLHNILLAMLPILYAGIMSSGIAFTLQTVAQKHLNPAVAALIMCLESVISAVSGWIILGEALSPREMLGCAIMFIAIVIATLRG